MEGLLLGAAAHRQGHALMRATEIALGQLIERTFGGRRRDVRPARNSLLEGVVVGDVDGDLFEGRFEFVQDLLVELGANPVSIEDGSERVGLVAPHKTIIFEYSQQPTPFLPLPHSFLQAWFLDKSLCLHQYIGSRVMSRHEGRLDHLELLKNTYSHGRHAKLRDGMIVFEKDGRFPLSQPTAWVAKQSGKNYSLGALWLYLQSYTGRLHDYMEKVTELGVDSVIKPDRKEIEAYFISGDERYSCINQQLKVELSTRSKVREQPNSGFEPVEAPSKRHKRDPMEAELQVMEFISKFERPVCSKTRSLRCPSKSLDPLLKLLYSNTEGKNDEKQLRIGMFAGGKRVPIIIVPESHTAGNICLANIEKFLTNGQYVSNPPKLPDHQRKCEIFLTIRGRKMTFEVCSNPKLLPPSEWSCVVAVFVQGRKQEFEGWPCSDPALIFRQAKGFLLHFAGRDESEAPLWNVKELTLERNMRYRDLPVQREILQEIQSLLFLPIEQGMQM